MDISTCSPSILHTFFFLLPKHKTYEGEEPSGAVRAWPEESGVSFVKNVTGQCQS